MAEHPPSHRDFCGIDPLPCGRRHCSPVSSCPSYDHPTTFTTATTPRTTAQALPGDPQDYLSCFPACFCLLLPASACFLPASACFSTPQPPLFMRPIAHTEYSTCCFRCTLPTSCLLLACFSPREVGKKNPYFSSLFLYSACFSYFFFFFLLPREVNKKNIPITTRRSRQNYT